MLRDLREQSCVLSSWGDEWVSLCVFDAAAPFLLDGLLGFRAGESRVKSHAESLMRKPEFLSAAGGIGHGSPAESSGGEDNAQLSSAGSLGSS